MARAVATKKPKKAVKKGVKKPAKKVVKKVVKKPGFKGPAAAQPSPLDSLKTAPFKFFSGENWGVQAVKLLGEDDTVPVGALGFVGLWVLLILRFTIFYGFFGTE